MVRTTMAGYEARAASGEPITIVDYDDDGNMTMHEEPFVMPTEEEVRQEIAGNIEKVKNNTPIFLDDTPPSASGIGIYWKNQDGTDPTLKQKSSMEAHEKGHVVRKFPGGEAGEKYYDGLFGKAFDSKQVNYTAEDHETEVAYKKRRWEIERDKFIEDNVNFTEYDESDFTYDTMKANMIDYLFSPEELTERMAQLKNWLGFRGDEEFRQEHLDYAREHYINETGIDNNMRHFFESIKNDNEFLHLMNTIGV